MLGTQASEAANLQGKFWDVTEHLLQNQSEWTSMDLAGFEQYLVKLAGDLGMDAVKFQSDLKSDAIVQLSQSFLADAEKAGITYTPFININGNIPEQPVNPQYMGLIIQLLKMEDKQYKYCPPEVIKPGKTYQAVIDTEKGKVVIDLFAEQAPLAVNSFVFLTQEGWYNQSRFFEVVRDTATDGLQVAVAGDPSETGYGSAGYNIGFENPSANFDKKGLVGMVKGNQFFITFAPQTKLSGRFTVIGQVVEGLDIAETFPVTLDASGNVLKGTLINSITIVEK